MEDFFTIIVLLLLVQMISMEHSGVVLISIAVLAVILAIVSRVFPKKPKDKK